MFIRITATELKEIIPTQYGLEYLIEDLDQFYIGHCLSSYTSDWEDAAEMCLLEENYILNVRDGKGDSRTKGGKLGKRDYELIRKELRK